MGRRRIPEPTVLVVVFFAAALIAAAVVLAGCDQSAEEPPTSDSWAAIEPAASSSRRARAIAERCRWDRDGIGKKNSGLARAVQRTFADPGADPVRLLLGQATVRPGAVLTIAVANDSEDLVIHGTPTHAELKSTGEAVEVESLYGFRSIALYVEPDMIGPCVTLVIPSDSPSGSYRAVLDDVTVGEPDGKGPTRLAADFDVAGEPIAGPHWERRLERARGSG